MTAIKVWLVQNYDPYKSGEILMDTIFMKDIDERVKKVVLSINPDIKDEEWGWDRMTVYPLPHLGD